MVGHTALSASGCNGSGTNRIVGSQIGINDAAEFFAGKKFVVQSQSSVTVYRTIGDSFECLIHCVFIDLHSAADTGDFVIIFDVALRKEALFADVAGHIYLMQLRRQTGGKIVRDAERLDVELFAYAF